QGSGRHAQIVTQDSARRRSGPDPADGPAGDDRGPQRLRLRQAHRPVAPGGAKARHHRPADRPSAGGKNAHSRAACARRRRERQNLDRGYVVPTATIPLRPGIPRAESGVSSLVLKRRCRRIYDVHRGRADPLLDRAVLTTERAARCPLSRQVNRQESQHVSRQESQRDSRVLIPPRPNLGPETWSEEPSSIPPLLAAGIALLVLLTGAIGIFFYRRRRSGRRTAKSCPAE